jgi:nucleoside phosphorylase
MLDWLLGQPQFEGRPFQPHLVISAGFCGALQHGYAVGDVVIATDVVDFAGQRWQTSWPERPLDGLDELPRHGRILSSPRIIATSADKRMLGHRYDAVAVDMETATIARRCAERGVPFGSVRAVSDDVDTTLSAKLLSTLSGGKPPSHLGILLIRHPAFALEIWRLARNTRIAAQRLAAALRAALP